VGNKIACGDSKSPWQYNGTEKSELQEKNTFHLPIFEKFSDLFLCSG
jgi:hypothetical protein